jgi:hypothetical protein
VAQEPPAQGDPGAGVSGLLAQVLRVPVVRVLRAPEARARGHLARMTRAPRPAAVRPQAVPGPEVPAQAPHAPMAHGAGPLEAAALVRARGRPAVVTAAASVTVPVLAVRVGLVLPVLVAQARRLSVAPRTALAPVPPGGPARTTERGAAGRRPQVGALPVPALVPAALDARTPHVPAPGMTAPSATATGAVPAPGAALPAGLAARAVARATATARTRSVGRRVRRSPRTSPVRSSTATFAVPCPA